MACSGESAPGAGLVPPDGLAVSWSLRVMMKAAFWSGGCAARARRAEGEKGSARPGIIVGACPAAFSGTGGRNAASSKGIRRMEIRRDFTAIILSLWLNAINPQVQSHLIP